MFAATALFGAALVFHGGSATAQEDEEEEIVTMKGGDGGSDAPKKKTKIIVVEGGKREGRPEVGGSLTEIEVYLRSFEEKKRDLKEKLRDARRAGDWEEEVAIRDELEAVNREFKDEQARLTERNPGLIAGGATLVGLGSLSFVVGLAFSIAWAVDDSPADGVGPAAVGGLLGGLVGIGAGAPMLAFGLRRTVREARVVPTGGPVVAETGLTLTWQF